MCCCCKRSQSFRSRVIVAGEKAWSGVFSEATDRRVEQFTESISFDRRLYAHDIARLDRPCPNAGQRRPDHCRRIASRLSKRLRAIRQEIEQGRFEFNIELEDIHMHIERALVDRLGDVGRKLHTARSRNDQVATDLRLWLRDAIDQIDGRLVDLQRAFVGRCDRDRRLHPAGLHAPAASPAGAGGPLLAGVLRKTGARSAAAGRLLAADQRAAAGRGGAGGHIAADRPRSSSPGGWDSTRWPPTVSTRRAIATSSLEFVFALIADRRAPERLGRGVDFVVAPANSISSSCRRRFAPARRSCRRR